MQNTIVRYHKQEQLPQGGLQMVLLNALLIVYACVRGGEALLYPRDTATREVLPLDGLWRFVIDPESRGFEQQWFASGLPQWKLMAVPASFNDATASAALRDHVGWAWYERQAPARPRWQGTGRVFLRFGSVHYFARVWVDGQDAGLHVGGHLPFNLDVTKLLAFDVPSRITVAVNNTLTPHTLPQGATLRFNDSSRYPEGYVVNDYTFDFFNYAGIHRPVFLYIVPYVYIDDISVNTFVAGKTGIVKFNISYETGNEVDNDVVCHVSLMDENTPVETLNLCQGDMVVNEAKLWWPVHMSATPAYLYTLQVELQLEGKLKDVYSLPVGMRTVTWNDTSVSINGEAIYMYGFGKHEDSNLRGKGLDWTLLVRDYSLLEWVGANCYRTSHYPYAEEALDLADQLGVLIVAESPAVNLDFFDDELLQFHMRVMSEMIQRDKNRPSVIMWSLSNEARTQHKIAGPYYKSLVEHVKKLDQSRPVGFVTNQMSDKDQAAPYMDIIGINRYFSWYHDTGALELVSRQVETEYAEWHNKFKKPVFISEYGADSIAGFHELPAFVWTEDYQVALLHEHFKAFDNLRKQGFFIGEMIWNFADFGTKQGVSRAQGNKKGIFTRERQPKHAAYVLRTRYQSLAKEQMINSTKYFEYL